MEYLPFGLVLGVSGHDFTYFGSPGGSSDTFFRLGAMPTKPLQRDLMGLNHQPANPSSRLETAAFLGYHVRLGLVRATCLEYGNSLRLRPSTDDSLDQASQMVS